MAFNPVDYYYLASWLNTQTNQLDEACARAVVAKAYYGCFLEARNRAGIADKTTSVHKKVHEHYSKAGNTALANRLKDLRLKRNDADYDTNLTVTTRNSGQALALARKILEELGVALV